MNRLHIRAVVISLLTMSLAFASALASETSSEPRIYEGEGTIYCEIQYLHVHGTCRDAAESTPVDFPIEHPSTVSITLTWDAISPNTETLNAHFQLGNCYDREGCSGNTTSTSPITFHGKTQDPHTWKGRSALHVPPHCTLTPTAPVPAALSCDGNPGIVMNQTFRYRVVVSPGA